MYHGIEYWYRKVEMSEITYIHQQDDKATLGKMLY